MMMKQWQIPTTVTAMSRKDMLCIGGALGIVLFFYLLPPLEGLTVEGQRIIGILLMAAVLWITEPIPLPATGILVMILQPLLSIDSASNVFSSFGNPAVFFLIGAFMIAGALEKHGLHRRMALRYLSFFEHTPRLFTLGIMSSCAILTFVMPAHGVAALFLPIMTSILLALKLHPKESNFGKISMLCVAYGCSIGSLGTLIGGARNPLVIGFLSEQGIQVSFIDWMILAMPVVFIALPVVWLILQFSFPIEISDISLAKQEISKQLALQGSLKKQEITVLIILFLTIFLWISFSSSAFFGLAGVALLGSVLLFVTGSISWNDVEQRVPWGIILVYGGAITLGISMNSTGAAGWIVHHVINAIGHSPYLVILSLIVFTISLTNIMSNTGAVAVLLPVGMAIAMEIPAINPLLPAMIIALSGGLSFMLVIATPGNAITYSSGYFSTKDLLRAGILANLSCIGILFLIAIFYWRGFLGI